MLVRRTLLQRGLLSACTSGVSQRSMHSSALLFKQSSKPNSPTHGSRTSPAQGTKEVQHPGYTSIDTPISDADPSQMPAADPKLTPYGQTKTGSTTANPQHPGVHEMAEGGKLAGQDAISVGDRNVKNWATNQRTPEFNEEEGKRRPILDGGSNEGGFDESGKSKT